MVVVDELVTTRAILTRQLPWPKHQGGGRNDSASPLAIARTPFDPRVNNEAEEKRTQGFPEALRRTIESLGASWRSISGEVATEP